MNLWPPNIRNDDAANEKKRREHKYAHVQNKMKKKEIYFFLHSARHDCLSWARCDSVRMASMRRRVA